MTTKTPYLEVFGMDKWDIAIQLGLLGSVIIVCLIRITIMLALGTVTYISTKFNVGFPYVAMSFCFLHFIVEFSYSSFTVI